jgi:hypothetical protein
VWVCSMQHIPSFLQHAEELKQKGVEQVVCVSVNDVFVMDAWCKSLAADGILMVVCTAIYYCNQNVHLGLLVGTVCSCAHGTAADGELLSDTSCAQQRAVAGRWKCRTCVGHGR